MSLRLSLGDLEYQLPRSSMFLEHQKEKLQAQTLTPIYQPHIYEWRSITSQGRNPRGWGKELVICSLKMSIRLGLIAHFPLISLEICPLGRMFVLEPYRMSHGGRIRYPQSSPVSGSVSQLYSHFWCKINSRELFLKLLVPVRGPCSQMTKWCLRI